MRSSVLLCLALAALLTGCAVQGVVVEKTSRPFPFYASVGMEGIYKFKLRDAQGHVCSQMVSPEVFDQYAVGDYFNDLQPTRRPRVQLEEIQTVRTVRRVAQASPNGNHRVARAHHEKTAMAAKRTARIHSSKARHPHHSSKLARARHGKKHKSKVQARHHRKSRLRPS